MLKSLGKFRIISEVGRGAMGVVYRAEDNLGRAVALKVPPPSLAVDKELLQRFNREARSAASLKHDNIVWIMESSEIDATPYIAMEFIEGETLAQIISSRRAMPIVRKLDIIIQTCRGLQYAHKKQVVHRDIKPSNIMVEHDGPVKIVDFGIAHLSGGTLLTLTQEGQRLGTPSYMSPEQTKGQPADPRSDIFSVGVVLFELLTYQKPFLGDEIGVVWYKIQNEPPTPLSELLPTCPPELQKVVSKALAKNRDDRYQTAEDLGFALQQVSDYFKHDMIEVYVQEGRRHLEEGNLTVAKESIQRALEIDSSHDVARSLFDQVQGQIEARRRAQRVEQIFRQAKEVLQAGQFDEAVRLLDEVLQLDPSHTEAPQYRKRAVDGRERRRKIRQHMDRAERLIADADLKGAKNELEAVLELDGAQSAAQEKLDSVLKELAEQERERQVRQHIQDARKLLAQKKFDQAGDLLEKALVLDAINIEAEALLRQVRTGQEKEKERQRREGRLAGIQEALNRQDIAHALALTEEALEDFPGDPQIFRLHAQATRLAELEKRRRSIEEQLQLARSFVQKDQYDEAIGVLERALEQFPDEARLTTYLETIREAREQAHIERLRLEAIRRAGALIREKKFAPAIGALEEALARAGESREILELLKFAREQQAEQQKEERTRQVIAWAEICLREQNFEEAARVLAEARRESSSPDLDALQATVGEQQQQFEQRRAEMMRQARRSLEAGEAAAAVALLENAPKACFKYQEFWQLHAECRAGLDRAAAIRGAAAEVEKAAVEGDLDHAQKLLRQALETYPNEAVLLAARERLRAEEVGRQRDGWRKLIDQAKAAIDRKDYEQAMRILAALPPELSKTPELAAEGRDLQEQARQGARALALRQEAIQTANAHIGNNQFALAVATLETASAAAGESPELAELLRSARDRRDDRTRQVVGKAQGLLAEDAYAEAIGILEQSEKNLGTNEISALLASARDREREYGLRRQETLQKARRLLEAGDAVKAAALLDAAPKAYVKDREYQGLYTQCREKLELAEFVSSTRARVENCLENQDLVHAEAALLEALGRYPREPVFLALQARLENERSRLRRLEWTKRVEDATLALDRTDYAGALEALEALPSEVSEEPDLASKAQALRAKAAQIERRTVARRQALDEAKRWISANDFAAAIEVLEKAEARDGPSPELKELLEYARLRKIEQERQDRVRQLQVKVQQFLVEDNYDEARRVLEQAQGLLETPEIEAQLATVRERQRQFEERLKQTLARVRQLLAAGKAAEAQSILDSAPKTYFKNEEFSRVDAACKEQVARSAFVESHLKQFEASIGAQDFARAEALLERAMHAYPQDTELLAARKRLEDARLRWREAQWSKVIDEARTAIAQMAFQRAIDLLAALTPEIGASPELGSQAAALLDEARQKEKAAAIGREAARVAQEQLKQGEHLRAIETLERALAVAGSSPEVDRLLKLAREQAEHARQERIRGVLDRARLLQTSNKYQEAVNVLEQARREGGAKEIDSLLAAVREQLRLAQQRDEIVQQARALLAAGNAAQALALLDSAPKAFLEDVEFSRLHADCGERVRRAEFISSTGVRFEVFFSAGDVAQARTALDGALEKYPNEPALLALEKRLEEEESRLERAERMRQVERVRAALERQEYRGALEILKALPADLSDTPELVSVVPELLDRARRMEQQALQRQQAIREANEQIRNNQFARAIATLETATAKAGSSTETDALLRSAQEGLRRQRDHHRDQLLAIELKIPGTRKSKLKGLQHQVQQIAAGYSAEDELASIAARLQQRIAAAIAVPGKPFPWRRVALGAAAAAVLVAGAELGFHLIKPSKPPEKTNHTTSVEIPKPVAPPVQQGQPQKGEHETTGGQQVEAETGEPRSPTPNPPLQPAKPASKPADKPAVPVAKGPTSQPATQESPPSQTGATNSPGLSPEPRAATTLSRDEAEWQVASDSTDPAVVAKYSNDFPDGRHKLEAQRRYKELDDQAWKTLNQKDNNDLQRYERDFLYGGHLKDAAQLIDDNEWRGADRDNLQKLQEFIDRHQNSSHLPEAQSILSKLKTEQSEAQAIQKALLQFNEAFRERKPDAVKQAWHGVPNRYLNAMRIPDTVFMMALYPAGKAVVNGNVASIDCRLTVTTGSRQKPTERRETVTLAKEGDHWAIVDIPGLT